MLRALKEPFSGYDDALASYIRLIMTISAGTIALRKSSEFASDRYEIGLAFLIGAVLCGALCMHYLLMLNKHNSELLLLNESDSEGQKQKWGTAAMWMYRAMLLIFLSGLCVIAFS